VSFSARLPPDLAPNRLSAVLARLAETHTPYIDLTASNPTTAGFAYPPALLAPLADPRGLVYAPEPFGLLDARRAVAADFSRRRVTVDPSRIALTASTSEAYSLLFKVLCNPGDEVLVPRPSYPLFDHLTRLEAVVAVPYDLEYHGRWSIDVAGLQQARSERARALLLVNPNNPTGSVVSPREWDHIAHLAAAHDLAVISDEVFADYSLTDVDVASAVLASRDDVLGFTLGGLSKSIGLPQAKLAWTVVSGPAAATAEAIARLEIAVDAYLSVGTPVQVAARALLRDGATVRSDIHRRVRHNFDRLRRLASDTPSCRVLESDAGWYGVVQVPAIEPEEELVLSLLEDDRVLVHPGYFFDFPQEAFIVVSLLPAPALFEDGLRRVLRRIDQRVNAR
jgi:alanine-synthesizing transaminase